MAFGCVTDPKLYFPKKIGVVAFGCVAHPKTIRSNKDRGNRFWQCLQPENSTLQKTRKQYIPKKNRFGLGYQPEDNTLQNRSD